jgi:hypothetical protein
MRGWSRRLADVGEYTLDGERRGEEGDELNRLSSGSGSVRKFLLIPSYILSSSVSVSVFVSLCVMQERLQSVAGNSRRRRHDSSGWLVGQP